MAPLYLPLHGSSFQGAILLQCGHLQLLTPGGRRGGTTEKPLLAIEGLRRRMLLLLLLVHC